MRLVELPTGANISICKEKNRVDLSFLCTSELTVEITITYP